MDMNEDLACYLVVKHSWKGRYERVFSVGSEGIATYNPNTLVTTNQWLYKDFFSITPEIKEQECNEFVIKMKKGKGADTMRFSTPYRAHIITEALIHRNKYAVPPPLKDNLKTGGMKLGWSDTHTPVCLQVTPCSIDQIDAATGVVLTSYNYKDLEALVPISGIDGGIAFEEKSFGRLHIFSIDRRDELIRQSISNAQKWIGVKLSDKKVSVPLGKALDKRMGSYSDDEHITSLCEFTVQKISSRHIDPVRRTICLSETCIVERDPHSYAVVTLHPLSEIFALVRHQENPQLLTIEYVRSGSRTYTSSDRDSLLASLVDGVRASGNLDVHVRMTPTPRGYRWGPFETSVEEDVVVSHLKFLQQPPVNLTFEDIIERFNANISYSGFEGSLSKNKEKKLIISALASLTLSDTSTQENASPAELEAQFHAMRRLIASQTGFSALTSLEGFREAIGMKVMRVLKKGDPGVSHAALDMICALMQPMYENPDLKQEQINKSSLLSSKKFAEKLMEAWVDHVQQGTGALVIVALLDFLTFALCAPYSETTDGAHFDTLLQLVAQNGRTLYRLFQHTSLAIIKGAGLVLKAIIEEGENEVPEQMQQLSLTEGALPRHLYTALFTKTTDGRLLTHRQLSRHLISLWTTENRMAMDLLERTVPSGLLRALESKDTVALDDIDRLQFRDNMKLAEDRDDASRNPVLETLDKAYKTSVRKVGEIVEKHMDKLETVEKTLQTGAKHLEKYYEQYLERHVDFALHHWRTRIQREETAEEKFRQKPLVLRKRRERLKSSANWPLFYYMFNRDHAQPNLIWNYKTREELRLVLEAEIRAFSEDRDIRSVHTIAWNHVEFEVSYGSLKGEIKIGEYYLRILLEQDSNLSFEESPIRKSYQFFNDLYHRFLLIPDLGCMCLQAMTLVYGIHHSEIGPFNDTKFIVSMLDRTMDKQQRDRLLLFLCKLIEEKHNVKELVDAGGVRILTDLMSLAHLHVSRAIMPTHTNVIEASPEMRVDSEKEWYYQDAKKVRAGPFSYKDLKDEWEKGHLKPKTLCWAQGMDGWSSLNNVPQLKWTLAASGQAVLTESDLAVQILNMLIKMCRYYPSRTSDGAIVRPLPKIKRLLSDSMCLPHIVQLLLTFDPVLVEKVAILLVEILEDNPSMTTVYTSGVFFFILMYTGSNVLPIGKFLHLTHMHQSFRSDDNSGGSIMQQSILGQILPEAMVCYLENYGPDKFAEIFLGEFDTPEAIWSNEMRRHMIEKLASHLADFSPRLLSNIKANYQYCAIPRIVYSQLANELFCDIYYLKHLCDIVRFPDWPIKDPVNLLKRVLMDWKNEVGKQPSSMSLDEAFETLGLPANVAHEDSHIRKAYFKLAQKYHPDKNPDGREIFEQVNKAYEYLCNRSPNSVEGPNPKNILLILRTQSILFSRFTDVLSPYKYSGYPMLIKTIKLEADDEQLFSKETSLLAAAAEVAYHTINCSALNAEELRVERGLEILQGAYSRCVNVISASSIATDVAVEVCVNVAKCFSAAALFPKCREKILTMSNFIKDLCHTLRFKNLSQLCLVGVECVCSFAVDTILQMNLLQAGVLWHLLLFLFQYDYTLEESGVSKDKDSNQQEVNNQLAKLSLHACGRLAGLLDDGENTPRNDVITSALSAMLTPYVVSIMKTSTPEEVLKILTSNVESPYMIWDNGTRNQLIDFLKDNQQKHLKYGESDPAYGAEFAYDAHKDELVIGGIFIRVYNEHPTFPIQKAKDLAVELLQYIDGETQYVHSLLSISNVSNASTHPRLSNVSHALQALANVIKNHQGKQNKFSLDGDPIPGIEMQCIGHFKLLFSLLGLQGCADVQRCVLALIEGVTANSECVTDIAASEVLVYLLLALYSPQLQPERGMSLGILHALMSNTKIVKEALNKGGIVYLLQLFCFNEDGPVREKTAELLGKMTSDKLVGPKVKLILNRLLPAPIVDHMRDSPPAAVHMYQGEHENPELIWTEDSRKKVSHLVDKLVQELYTEQRKDPNYVWKFPEDISLSSTCGEIVVGGVYMRLLVGNPSCILRKPKQFVTELFDDLLDILSKSSSDIVANGDRLELIVSAIVSVFPAQRNLLEYLPSLGHIPRIVNHLQNHCLPSVRAAALSVHQFTFSKTCSTVLENTSVISGLMFAMKLRPDLVGASCEALHNLFSGCSLSSTLVEQALKADMVPFLLSLLEDEKLQVVNPSSTKAQIVTCLKTMAASSQYSDEVTTILEKSPIWGRYRDQKHDLFLDNTPVMGYLTAGTPTSGGYLTQGTRILPTSPPSQPNPNTWKSPLD